VARRYIRLMALDRHAAAVDALVPVPVGGVIVVGLVLHGGSSVTPPAIAVGVAAAAVLWARRLAPGWTLAISGVLVAVLLHVDAAAAAVAVLAPAVALYSLALTRGRREQLLAAAAAVTAVAAADLLLTGRPTLTQSLGHMLLVAIPLLAAEAMRNHRSYLALLEERLELAERTREQEADRRAETERMRIARELHDVVAHTLTGINVQAAAAAEQGDAAHAHATLERIERASHDAVHELRAILGILRSSDGATAPVAPAPGVDDIGGLIERARDGELDVELTIAGEQPPRLSEVTSLTAYRIIQESLTNARKHAAGAPVRIAMSYDGSELSITVENGRTALANGSRNSGGVGLAGMRERAAAAGGTLLAGPTARGFRVRAALPYKL
jgi:signal transduction histidine kinase